MGPVAPRHVGSSQNRARTRVPCIGRQTLNHCATREALYFIFNQHRTVQKVCLSTYLYSFLFFNMFLIFILFIIIYFWLRWVLIAAHGLSLVAVSGGYSSLWCAAFSLRWLLLLRSMGSRSIGFSSCGVRAQ